MCYSAQIAKDYRQHLRESKGQIDSVAFSAFYASALAQRLRRPKAMDALFRDPRSDQDQAILELIKQADRGQLMAWQDELQRQQIRLQAAEHQLSLGKVTKKALNDQRVATDKVRRLTRAIQGLQRPTLSDADARIYPMWFAPVMIWEHGRAVVKPMRYHCRPAGKPAGYDGRYPGLYNARRDNLEKFWSGQFGHSHGILLATAFYENVSRHDVEGRALGPDEEPENVVLEFRPDTGQIMHVACLWSRWQGTGGDELLSFAAITDEPPPEVAAAGHDRCIVPIDPGNLSAWLNPERDIKRSHQILDARQRPFYQHRAAA